MKAILTCAKICLALYWEAGLPIKGMPDKCLCGEVTAKDTPPPLPITLKIRDRTPAKAPEEQADDRPTAKYDE